VDPVAAVRADTLDLPSIDLKAPEFDADPAAVFADARRLFWVARTSEGFAVLGHRQARAVFRHPAVPFAFAHVDPASSPYLHEKTTHHIQALHGAEHARLRRVALGALRDRVVERLREPMRAIVASLVDRVVDRGECDIVRDLTDPYPTRVVAPILGVPESDCGLIDAWASDLLLIFDSARFETLALRVEAAWREIDDYLAALLEERRRSPGDDIYSELVRAEAAGVIDGGEIVTLAIAMTQAALDTTRGQLGFTMECLVRHPSEWARLVADPALAEWAVEEGLRYAPAVGSIPHRAVADAEIDGVVFPSGSVIAVHPRAVNRDPEAFPDADRFDITREPALHFTFGFGAHACLGSQLARIEMAEALRVLASRVESWELAGEVRHQPMSSNGNRLSLPVRFRPRAMSWTCLRL
jgi:cytochrome P450